MELALDRLKEPVTITCYGKTETLTRRGGLEKFYKGMKCSEGAEHERYETIFFQLLEGHTEVSDEIPFWGF